LEKYAVFIGQIIQPYNPLLTGQGGKPKTLVVHAKAFACVEPFFGWNRLLEFLEDDDCWTMVRDGDALHLFETATRAGLPTWGRA
jgi:hypothetical protein